VNQTRITAVTRLNWTDAHLCDIALPTATMRLTRSLASGLTRSPLDPPGTFWGVGDRGPNLKPGTAVVRYACDHLAPLAAIDGAKIMPLPDSGPAIARFRIDGDTVHLEAAHDLATQDGQPISGRPVPHGPDAEFEPVFDLAGTRLPNDPDGADSEAIIALADGTFWVAEEYGPSLLRVDRQGRILHRWVPHGTGHLYAGSRAPIIEALPALAIARKLNRGFESIALTDDGDILIANQSPLAHPDRAAHEGSRTVRLWQLDGATGALIHEWAYRFDKPESFRRDTDLGKVARDDIKLSEILCLPRNAAGHHRLLLLERVTASTRFHLVTLDPAQALDAKWSDPATRPTLEQLDGQGLSDHAIPLLEKTLLFSTDDWPDIDPDLEGMVLLSPTDLLISNDSDYGTEGAETRFWRISFDQPLG
jgi:hypothetical protein